MGSQSDSILESNTFNEDNEMQHVPLNLGHFISCLMYTVKSLVKLH